MKVTVLGSGTVDPLPQRASTGFLLETGAGSPIVIDLGAGALRNGMLAGIAMHEVETVILTHHHPDHTSDLVPFLFARKYAPGGWQQSPRLKLYGPAGTGAFLDHVFAAWPSIKPDDGQFEVIEVKPEDSPVDLRQGLRLSVFPAVHGDMTALCLRVQQGGKAIGFSGDTALCPEVVEAARGVDLFLCECSCFPRGVEPLHCRKVHLSWEDVAEICRQAGPGKVVLTHLYQAVLERKPDPLECLIQALDIPVELASDLAVYQV